MFPYQLRKHMGSHLVREDKFYKCPVGECPHSFSAKQDLVRHQKTHEGVHYLCPICNKFDREDPKKVHEHILQFHGPSDQYTCECGVQCQKRNKMNRHTKKCGKKVTRRIWDAPAPKKIETIIE